MNLLRVAPLAAAFAACVSLAQAAPETRPWSTIVARARGQTVYWNAWGGDDRTNAFIAWAGGEVKRRYGITIEQVKLKDTASFLKQALHDLVVDPSVLQSPATEATFATVTAPLWRWYDQLRPNLWRGGREFPESGPAQRQLINDGEIDLHESLDPAEAAVSIANHLLPETARVYAAAVIHHQGAIRTSMMNPAPALPGNLLLTLDTDPPLAFRAELGQRIQAFHAETVPVQSSRFALQLHDAENRLLGGLSGVLAGGWLFVDALWVDAGLRGRGAGRALMARAETHAKAADCHSAWLDTFQASGFYEALGYRVFGALEDYPGGQTRVFLRKRLI